MPPKCSAKTSALAFLAFSLLAHPIDLHAADKTVAYPTLYSPARRGGHGKSNPQPPRRQARKTQHPASNKHANIHWLNVDPKTEGRTAQIASMDSQDAEVGEPEHLPAGTQQLQDANGLDVVEPSATVAVDVHHDFGPVIEEELLFGPDTSCVPSCVSCCGPSRVFGEYLYLRPGNDKVSYAVPIDGAIVPPTGAPPIQIGNEGVVDNDFASGFRVGWERPINPFATIAVVYTHFEGDEESQVSIDAPFVLRSLVSHPGTQSAPTDFLDGSARSDIDFKLADIAFSRNFVQQPSYWIDWQIGLRYGNLEQQFNSTLTNSFLIESVETGIKYDGGGFRVGLAAERRVSAECLGFLPSECGCPNCGGAHGWSLYGNAFASFLGGSFRTNYIQRDNFTADPIVNTGWKEDRIVPILDIEFGFNWVSPNQRWRFNAGYLFSAWYNVVKTDEFINGVRTNLSNGISDTLTFDGLVTGVEWRY